MRLKNLTIAAVAVALLSSGSAALAQPDLVDDNDIDKKAPKELNDPLPPQAMPENTPPGAVPTPRGTPEGMGNETDFSKTPGDDDASDGVTEPGRNPIPGQPRKAPGVEHP
ncbi:MAG TPA: hypothetical protein VEL28_10615 [Candidatus Binatia bacterium]|nr:hypothetical protein [Candidatus Binatia bacterium]